MPRYFANFGPSFLGLDQRAATSNAKRGSISCRTFGEGVAMGGPYWAQRRVLVLVLLEVSHAFRVSVACDEA